MTCKIIGLIGLVYVGLLYFAEKRAGNDPDFKIAEKFTQMPRDEVYDEAVRIYTNMIQKAKNYGYLDTRDGGLEENVLHFYVE